MIRAPRRVVLTYGRFDKFSPYHSSFLRRLAALGHELIVGCSTDEFALHSGHRCLQPYAQRRNMLESCRFVSRVIAEETRDQKYTDIVNYNVSIFAMSSAWAGQFDHLRDIARVHYMAEDEAQWDIVTPNHVVVA